MAQLPAFNLESSSGGNGEYYGGKLVEGIYVRTLPESKCGQGKSFGEIRVDKNGIAKAAITDQTSCAVNSVAIAPGVIEFAAYDAKRIGLKEGIYTRRDKDKTVPPADETRPAVDQSGRTAEAWCRVPGSTSQEGYDISILADYASKNFTASVVAAKIVKGNTIRKEYASPNLEREVEIRKRIRYRSDEFRLEIDTETFDRATGKMRAEFRFDADDRDTDLMVDCRVGGELDIHFGAKPYDLSK